MLKKKFGVIAVLLFVVVLLAGCYEEATINTYSDPSFDENTITKLAIFPIKNTKIAPGESRTINRKIAQGIHKSAPNIEIMSSNEAVNKLNEEGLADDWAQFLANYNSSGVPNSKMLFKIGDALNVDGIMQGEIVNVQQSDGSYGYSSGTTRVTVRYSILGVDSGKLLWEASSDGIRKTATTMEDAPPLIEAILLAQEKIMDNLPF